LTAGDFIGSSFTSLLITSKLLILKLIVMKTLKFIVLAMLLALSVSGFSEPNPSAKSIIEAQNQLCNNIKRNLFKWNVINEMDYMSSADFVVYFVVNEQSNVEVLNIMGDKESIKQNVISLMESHPIEAPSILKGKIFSLKLLLVSK